MNQSRDIVLTTLNSTYQHAAFGLRYLLANLGSLQPRAIVKEFTIKSNTREVAEDILSLTPKIVGIGVYIWNASESLELAQILKKVDPEITLVLGGPEVSYESEGQAICQVADYVLKGESDFSFRELCQNILSEVKPATKYIRSALPDIALLKTPYELYTDEDIKNRIVYVEASRGCPYKCEYCLSSLDKSVRNFPIEPFLKDMQTLVDRGVRQFKFIDRTFNLSPKISSEILKFFLKHVEKGLFLHFEMVPDRLPVELRDLIAQFPAGSLQFEIGIQTFNPDTAKSVSRKNDLSKVEENFRYLRENTKVHTHADLIVGLPGETLESFGQGFDQLYKYAPDEIQVGLLKRLKGTPIIRHDAEFKMTYQDHPPFQILQTSTISFSEVQTMVRFSKFWDLYANSGHFPNTMKLLIPKESASPFSLFMKFTDYLNQKYPAAQHGISLMSLSESLHDYLITEGVAREIVRECMRTDYCRDGLRSLPKFLFEDLSNRRGGEVRKAVSKQDGRHIPARQRNHLM